MTGTTIEVNNTDAEGRLVLADCLACAIEQGAERLVDLATLTGAIVSRARLDAYAGLMSNDDEWAEQVARRRRARGELVWRLPLHEEYGELIKGRYADIANAVEDRKAGSITAARVPAAASPATCRGRTSTSPASADDYGRPYAGKGGSGFGVRLLVELARANAGAPDLH